MELENHNYHILVVDDTIDIHKDFRKILTPYESIPKTSNMQQMNRMFFGKKEIDNIKLPPFKIDSAYQGAEAVALAEEAKIKNKPYAVAFVDVQMPPGMDGVETIKRLWEVDPDIQVVICTAYALYSWQDLIKHLGESDRLFVLKKPFDALEIINLATSLSHRWNLQKVMDPLKPHIQQAQSSGEPSEAKNKFEQALDALKKLNRKLDDNRSP